MPLFPQFLHWIDHIDDDAPPADVAHEVCLGVADGMPVMVYSRAALTFLYGHPALGQLIHESAEHVRRAFGQHRFMKIRLLDDDELSVVLVDIHVPCFYEGDPAVALQAFDDAWWLGNCHRSAGQLVFDYEVAERL